MIRGLSHGDGTLQTETTSDMGQTHYRGVYPEALGEAVVKASKSSSKGARTKAPAGRGAASVAAPAKKAAAPKRGDAAAAASKTVRAVTAPKPTAPKKPVKVTKPAGKAAPAPSAKAAVTAKAAPAPAAKKAGKPAKAEKSRTKDSTKATANDMAKDVAKDGTAGRMRDPIAPIDTIRTPAKADDLKVRLGRISSVIAQLRTLKRTMERSFFEVGELLTEVQESRLFEVKGYGSLESFLDRETELGSSAGVRAMRATTVFQKAAAETAGFSRISAALRALDGEPEAPSVGARHSSGSLPPHKL